MNTEETAVLASAATITEAPAVAQDIEALEAEERRLWEAANEAELPYLAARAKWSAAYTKLNDRKIIEKAKAELLAENAAKEPHEETRAA